LVSPTLFFVDNLVLTGDLLTQQGPYQISGRASWSTLRHSGWYAFSHPSQHIKSVAIANSSSGSGD
jgi:hypothetical protein